ARCKTAQIRRLAILCVGAALWAAACGSDGDDGSSADTGAPTSTGGTTATDEAAASTTEPDDSSTSTPPTDATTTTEFATVTSQVTGVALGGNSGGVGGTNEFSEVVRNADGSCEGWDGGTGGRWTQGLQNGANVTFLARDTDEVIGEGTITSSSAEDADPSDDNEQWQCSFAFSGSIAGDPDTFRIKVADLNPWVVFPDPARPGEWVTSVDTPKEADMVFECVEQEQGIERVERWNAVGTYWASGLASLCFSGLTIADVQAECRPRGIGSDHIIRVVRADDPSVVLEDANDILVNVEELEAYTPVIVFTAIGRACA
ncbi:MAG TPA: hypothetical protein VGK49_13355, partial [Ilumatobacteraceae bacterium]